MGKSMCIVLKYFHVNIYPHLYGTFIALNNCCSANISKAVLFN